MKKLLALLGASLLAVGLLSAVQPTRINCRCNGCQCTHERHCGCFSKSGCHCAKNCQCGDSCACGNTCS